MSDIPIRIGVDLGGTKIEAAAVRLRGDSLEVVARRRVPTPRQSYEAIVASTVALVSDLSKESGADFGSVPLGIGMPGGVTRRGGLVKNSNATCLNGRPFRDDLSASLGRSVVFENDANCFALAEARLGAGRGNGRGVVFGVIMGTGVGGGVVSAGTVWPGLQGVAGEWGHHRVYATPQGKEAWQRPCYCGHSGCVETYLSGPAVERDYERLTGTRCSLAEIAKRVSEDGAAAEVMDTFLEAFGRALANVINILDPAVVVLGGGVSNLDCLYREGVARVAKYVFNDELRTPIVRHELGDSAGVFGAALLEPRV